MQSLSEKGFTYLLGKAGYVNMDGNAWSSFHAEGWNIVDRSKNGMLGPIIFDLQRDGKSIRAVEIRTDLPRLKVEGRAMSATAKTKLRYGRWMNNQFVRD